MGRAILTVLLFATVVAAGDAPTFKGLTPDQWAARLADPSTRDEAGAELATGTPEAIAVVEALPDVRPVVTALIVLLADDEPSVRRQAALELWHIGHAGAAAVPALVRALSDPEEDVADDAMRALGNIGAAAVPALLGTLGDPYQPAREEAQGALWQLGDPAIRLLVERFRTSEDRAALGAALASGEMKALPYLLPLLAKPEVPWLKDAEAALALVGWEALYALPADHPSAPRVAARVLGEGVVRHARPPERYRAVAAVPPKADPLAIDATWETGNGHGFTLALQRGRWTPGGFSVRAMSYCWRRPRRLGEKEVETVSVRTATIPRARAEAMMRMVLAATGITFEQVRAGDGTGWHSSNDFHATVALRDGDALIFDEGYTGYASSGSDLEYTRVVACTDILGEGLETCEWTETEPNDEDRAILAARLARIAKDGWWVRERLLLMAKAIGDARCLPPIEAFLTTEPDETPRDHRYAIDAYARISGIDLRPTPFRDVDVAATRLRYLAHFAKRDG